MFYAVFNGVLGFGAAMLSIFSNKSRMCIQCYIAYLLLLLMTLLLSESMKCITCRRHPRDKFSIKMT